MVKIESWRLVCLIVFFYATVEGQIVNEEISNRAIERDTHHIGKYNASQLNKIKNEIWYRNIHRRFTVNSTLLSNSVFTEEISNMSFKIFVGTWCPDSKRFLPRFLKILEFIGVNESKIEVIGVGRSKLIPELLINQFQIRYVPTVIFFRDKKELNRLVEFPQKTIEEDFYDIVTNQNYKPFRN